MSWFERTSHRHRNGTNNSGNRTDGCTGTNRATASNYSRISN